MQDELRAVIEAARAWRAKRGVEASAALEDAVNALEAALAGGEKNKPTGFILTRPWSLVPAGWFVKTPNGEWWEIAGTALFEDGKQFVSMISPAGKRVGPYPRDPNGEVKVRRGTQSKAITDAIEALSDVFGGIAIIEDTPPWDEEEK